MCLLLLQELLRVYKLELGFNIIRLSSQAARSRHHGCPQVLEHSVRATGPLSNGSLSDPNRAASRRRDSQLRRPALTRDIVSGYHLDIHAVDVRPCRRPSRHPSTTDAQAGGR